MDKVSTMPDRATALIRKGDSILMLRRILKGRKFYALPGGKVEPGETLEAAVMREVAEETCLQVELGKRVAEFQTLEGRKHSIFECIYLSGEPKLADGSPEKLEYSPDNMFEPCWIRIDMLSQIEMWPAETKPLLISYLK